LLRFFIDQKRRTAEGGFTLIELVVVLAILGILLALAVPRYLGARKRAFKAEIDNILQEAKTLSWAYYQEHDLLPFSLSNIGLQMPVGSAWNTPAHSGGGSGASVTWTSSGQAGGAPVETADACSVTLFTGGNASQGCNF
jgi:prepilin-type N-terminal cleavage/methylation domain-containing protein